MLALALLWASLREWSEADPVSSRFLSRAGHATAALGLVLVLAGLSGWQACRSEALAAAEVALVADAAVGAACTGRPASEPRCVAALATVGWARWTQTQSEGASVRWIGAVVVGVLL